jgi:hypothetical protein
MSITLINNNFLSLYINYLEDCNKFLFSIRRLEDKLTNYLQEKIGLIDIIYDEKKNIINYNNTQIINNILPTMCHNISVCKINNIYYGIGGVSFPSSHGIPSLISSCKNNLGLYLTSSINLVDWSTSKLIIDRDWGYYNNVCSFDSHPSFFYNDINKFFYLYVRCNPSAGVRKIQLFRTKDIYNWSNNAIPVKIEQNLNIYTAYIFIYNNKFYAIAIHYENGNIYSNTSVINNCLLVSNDGINFNILIKDYVSFKDFGFIVNNSLHVKNEELYIYFATEKGVITEHRLNIDNK